jgi:hypothetical protein
MNISSESSFSILSEMAVLSMQLRAAKAMGQCYAGNLQRQAARDNYIDRSYLRRRFHG